MSVYAINDEGVAALNKMATTITESAGAIKEKAANLGTTMDSFNDVIGPHEESIRSAIEDISSAIGSAAEPVETVSNKLNQIAQQYSAIIDNDTFGGSGRK